jgi:hypothetical protein
MADYPLSLTIAEEDNNPGMFVNAQFEICKGIVNRMLLLRLHSAY